MGVVGRCEAPGCERSTRVRVDVRSGTLRDAAVAVSGMVCPRHVTSTELGALLRGWTVERRA